MPGSRAPRTIRAQRHKFALEKLASGTPFAEVVALVACEWGCSRRQAQNVTNAALNDLAKTVNTMDIAPLILETVHRLQRLADKAERAGQYAAAVGAVRSLHQFAIAPHYSQPKAPDFMNLQRPPRFNWASNQSSQSNQWNSRP